MVRLGSIIWAIICLCAACCAGVFAYSDAAKFSGVVDLLATIITILIGVSLAVIAVLSSPFSVSETNAKDTDEAARMSKLIKQDDDEFSRGQVLLFWVYYVALFLALSFKWIIAGDAVDFSQLHIRILAAITATICTLAFFWSARLPLLLQQLSSQRRKLG